MNKQDQKRIVKQILSGASEEIVKKITAGKVPEHWDGFELRQFVKDYIEAHYAYAKMGRSRLMKYNRDAIPLL